MDQKSTTQTHPESTPKRSRWDTTPMVRHELNADPRRLNDRTPSRPNNIDQTPSRFS